MPCHVTSQDKDQAKTIGTRLQGDSETAASSTCRHTRSKTRTRRRMHSSSTRRNMLATSQSKNHAIAVPTRRSESSIHEKLCGCSSHSQLSVACCLWPTQLLTKGQWWSNLKEKQITTSKSLLRTGNCYPQILRKAR